MPLFKSFKAPKATISMSVSKDNFNLGDTIEGSVNVASQEDFEADEIRIELVAFERLRPGGGFIRDNQENSETRVYSQPNQNAPASANAEYAMYRGQTRVSQKLRIPNGFVQQFSFNIPSV